MENKRRWVMDSDADFIEKDQDIDAFAKQGTQEYMNSLLMTFMKAIYDLYGDINVSVEASFNYGFLTRIDLRRGVCEEDCNRIFIRMKELIQDNIRFTCNATSRKKAIQFCNNRGYSEKKRLIEMRPEASRLEYYELDGYINFFYGDMVPSTGCIKSFEIKQYLDGILLRLPMLVLEDGGMAFRDDYKLIELCDSNRKWREKVGIGYLADLNRAICDGSEEELIKESEARMNNSIEEIAGSIVKSGKRIVLVSGPSSSGKTTFTKKLCAVLEQHSTATIQLGTDDYFIDRDKTPLDEDGEPDYESLSAIDLELFNNHLINLLLGNKADIPTYNFLLGEKEFGKRVEQLEPGMIIVIEGIHSLNGELTKLVDEDEKFKIYLSTLAEIGIDRHNRMSASDIRLLRRMVRDNRTRGNDIETTLSTWRKVRLGEEKNIFPFSNCADVIFNSNLIYELAILKKYAKCLLDKVKPNSSMFGEAARLLRLLEPFEEMQSDAAIPDKSLLREFIGHNQEC